MVESYMGIENIQDRSHGSNLEEIKPYFSVSSPLFVKMPGKGKKIKKLHLNLNAWRQAHFFTLAKAKELYKIDVPNIKISCPVIFIYRLHPARECDLENVVPCVSKFLSDVLVNEGVIVDDSVKWVKEVRYKFAEFDKKNPRVELEVYDYENCKDLI